MQHARKNSLPKRFLRRPSSGGKSSSNGSTRTKSDEFGTPAVAVDHQNYYYQQHRHDAVARTSKPSAQTAPGRELPTFRSPEYGGDLSTTQVRPPTKITGIRRPGPKHHVTAPVAATGNQKQPERGPRSTRVDINKAGYQERQNGRGSPEGTRRRSPRDISPPNFSRKTATPIPEKGRSRSNSKTRVVPTVTLEAAEPIIPLDGGYILQAKTYTPPTQTTIISVNQPQVSYFSPFTESESGSSNGDSLSIASSSMGQSLPSPLSTPSQSPVVTRHISPGRKHVNSSSSNASNQRERYPNPSLASSLEKELPLLPASVYQPTTTIEIEVKGQKKNTWAENRESEPRKQEQQRGRRMVDSPLPPKRSVSSTLNAAPPIPPVQSHPQKEAEANPPAVAVSDAEISGPKRIGNLYNRRQKIGPSGDSTTSLSSSIKASILAASAVSTVPSKADKNTHPVPAEKKPTPPASPASLAARIALRPLNTQRAKESISRSRSPSRHRDNHGPSSHSTRGREASDLSEFDTSHFLLLSPNATTLVPMSHMSVCLRLKQGNEASKIPSVEEDREMQRLTQELENDFRGLASAEAPRQGQGSRTPPCRLRPLSPEQQRQSVCVGPLNLRKELKKSPRLDPSPSRDVTSKFVRPWGGDSSPPSRKDTPPPTGKAGDRGEISRLGQGSPSKGGRDEGNRFNALKRRDEFVRYHGGFF